MNIVALIALLAVGQPATSPVATQPSSLIQQRYAYLAGKLQEHQSALEQAKASIEAATESALQWYSASAAGKALQEQIAEAKHRYDSLAERGDIAAKMEAGGKWNTLRQQDEKNRKAALAADQDIQLQKDNVAQLSKQIEDDQAALTEAKKLVDESNRLRAADDDLARHQLRKGMSVDEANQAMGFEGVVTLKTDNNQTTIKWRQHVWNLGRSPQKTFGDILATFEDGKLKSWTEFGIHN